MKEIITLIIVSALLFLAFIISAILGFTKKSSILKSASLIVLLAFLVCAVWTGYKMANKTYSKVAQAFKPRTGDEIYEALYGKRQTNCVNILDYQDQVIPKIDYAIWLHFKTCKAELKRILSLHSYEYQVVSTHKWNTQGPTANENWFKPESLGDSILTFIYSKDNYGNGQYIYSSLDSTEVFVKDILD
jgi:flagellar basal body-associated protein FliL